MKNSLYILILVMTLACNSSKVVDSIKMTKFYYVNYNLEFSSELYLDTVEVKVDTKILDSIYSVTYLYLSDKAIDTITYNLKESEYYQPEYYLNGEKMEANDFVFVSKKKFQISGQDIDVYKFARNPLEIDGCVTHFWTPDIGVLIKRSTTWRNFSKLQTNDFDLNQKINLLTELIYQDTEFYKGCVEEQELIPKSIIKEFFDWKMKEIEKEIK